ncbi:hypothetical protein MTR_6g034900 [Medicago truncatula]|uniref:Transmembrane protein n=1 Tax=Medicago truncatula TaxID=3880 RepID=A0A072UJ53_MEDTR|nr:hypothetical protein MTR_6g034900 [Medicago truncatula]
MLLLPSLTIAIEFMLTSAPGLGVDIGRVRVQTSTPAQPAGVEYTPISTQIMESDWLGSGESGYGLNGWVQTGWTN